MLRIHFLNVGHGDCTLIEHSSNRLTIIDINNGCELDPATFAELSQLYDSAGAYSFASLAASMGLGSRYALLKNKGYDIRLTNPLEYLNCHYPYHHIFRYIQTHPDLDHMRGLTALVEKSGVPTNFWDTIHSKSPDFISHSDKEDWWMYQNLRSSKFGNRVLNLYRGNEGAYWNQDPLDLQGGDGIEILAPTYNLVETANNTGKTNNLSYVLRITYRGVKIILGGDAEKEVWDSIVEQYGEDLRCDVLKASHHGRDSGFHQEAIKLMTPQYTIVSVGKKPETDASNKYRLYSQNVWSTRWKGNIVLSIPDTGQGTIDSEYDR